MEVFYPAFYNDFSCIAAACPDSCCKEWDVDVDAASAARYRALPGPLGDRLRQVLRDTEGSTVMTIENGRCPMWQQDGLCRIQRELGHDALCQVCQQFPRLRHDYGSFAELGLELSCPEAARLILTAPWEPFLIRQEPGGETPDYDGEAMDILLQSRSVALELLGDPAYSVPEALILLYFQAHHAQTLLDGGEAPSFVPEELLALARKHAKPGSLDAIVNIYRELEILTPQWQQRLDAPRSPALWTDSHRNLARYFTERYWLQAVSDYDLLCRAKFILISCLLIRGLGGSLLQTAQLYSKEIENSSENMDALLDSAYCHPALTDDRLWGLLLGQEDTL